MKNKRFIIATILIFIMWFILIAYLLNPNDYFNDFIFGMKWIGLSLILTIFSVYLSRKGIGFGILHKCYRT